MNSARASIRGVWVAFFVAACGGSPTSTPQTSGQGGSSGGGPQTGRTNTGAQGGTTFAASGQGGSAAGTTGGTSTAGVTGGASAADTTGGKSAAGGTSSVSATGGKPAAGGTSNASPTSGKTGNAGGATIAEDTGGKASTGGGTSAGGNATGGTQAQGGATSATGGATSASTSSTRPPLITSADGAFWKTGTVTPVTTGTADVTADDASKNQQWNGFGGTFNEAGWDALSVLSASDKQLALTYLFDAANGANFVYGRLPIGASDYALSRYTLDDSTSADYNMDNFSIERDKQSLILYIKAALAVKSDIHLWASPWTPPAWMKDNNNIDAGNMKDDAKVLTAFALYLEKFVQAYAAEGVTIEAIHPQNEPGYSPPYPSCAWTEALYIKFIRDYLGPKFTQDNITAQIWCGTMSAPSDGTIAKDLAKDTKAMSYVKGFGLQWNTKDAIPTLQATKQPIMQSEHKCGNYSFSTDYWDNSKYDANKPQNDYAYGVESWKNIRDWIKAGVNAYSAWNMVLDTSGKNLNATTPWHQDALLTVDRTAKKLTATPAYYVFRHLSQYVAPKSTLIGVTGAGASDALAFKNPDGTTVVVMYNSGAAKKAIVSVGGTKLQFDMPSNGFATVVK